MRPVQIAYINHHDDGTATVKYIDYRVERITVRDEITAISREFAKQKRDRENAPPSWPTLNN